MKKQCNEVFLGDIKGFSNALYKVLGLAVILYAAVIAMHILSEVWPIFDGTVDVIRVGGWPFAFDIHLLRIAQSSAFIPVVTFGLILFGENVTVPASTMAYFALVVVIASIAHGIFMALLLYFRFLFKELKNGVSPFSEKMVWRILMIAIIATISAIANITLTSIIFIAFIWLMYYIFDYGRKLQNESDTTL